MGVSVGMGCCDGASLYKPGDLLKCRVLSRESEGYSVAIGPHLHPGVMSATVDFEIGQEVEVLFVCMLGDKAIVAPRQEFDSIWEEMRNDSTNHNQPDDLEKLLSTGHEKTFEERVLLILSMNGLIAEDLRLQFEDRLKQGESFIDVIAVTVPAQVIESYLVGKDLLASGRIDLRQLTVAFYDQCASCLSLTESLKIRGWIAADSSVE